MTRQGITGLILCVAVLGAMGFLILKYKNMPGNIPAGAPVISTSGVVPGGANPGQGVVPIPVPMSFGYVAGQITIGPNCPGPEREGYPCSAPAEAYTSREALAYESDGKTIKQRTHLDTEGNYRMPLPPGNYFLQISPAGIGPGEKKPALIKSNQTTVVNFDIDTGIR